MTDYKVLAAMSAEYDYAEIVRELRQDASTSRDLYLADAIEELRKPRWIPVTDRLPESRQSVLCYNEGGQWGQLAWIDIQTFVDEDGTSGFWHNRRYENLVGQVTHWMPLPEPPKEE